MGGYRWRDRIVVVGNTSSPDGEFGRVHGRTDGFVGMFDAPTRKIRWWRRLGGSGDDHLRSADFLDVEHHPEITFKGNQVETKGEHDYAVTGDLTIRGVTRQVSLNVSYLGQWQTPWWEDGVNKGPKTRAGFVATSKINRQDFGVSWQDTMDRGGIVVGNEIDITIDAEAILEDE